MGPTGVRRRLRRGQPVGVRNRYLNRVNSAHLLISDIYKRKVLSQPLVYKSTYVVKRKAKISAKKRLTSILDFSLLDDALRKPASTKRLSKIVFI